jgi:hypothetical protein
LEDEFGKEAPLNKSRGKIHDYLGMKLDFLKPREVVTITMINYIKSVLHDVPKEMHGKAVTPAVVHLFQVNSTNPVYLDEAKADMYVRVVMQLLFLSQCAHPDIHPAKVIAVHDVLMPQLMWTGYFLLEQGFCVKESLLYQGNTSSILIEKNGQSSCSKWTGHMNIRYFFVKDQVDLKRVRIEHCPTADMIADYFTKPLQGAPFQKLRDLIMKIDPSSEYHSTNSAHRSVLRNIPTKENSSDVTKLDTSPPLSYKEALLSSQPQKE